MSVEDTFHVKERLIVSELKEFLDTEEYYRILVLVGIRRIGKTTALRQLALYQPDSAYINFAEINAEEKLINFMQNPKKLLLLDEISFHKNYIDDVRHIEEQSVQEGYKVIITGSSPTHLMSLYGGPLGGGRSTMKRLSLLSFVEYLYFSDRIKTYECQYEPTEADFLNYLRLRDIPKGLRITFDKDYFRTFYSDVELSNRNTSLARDNIKIQERHLNAICDLLAYKLQLNVKYHTFIQPDIGAKEIPPMFRTKLDFSDTILQDSVAALSSVTPSTKATALHFMLKVGIAYVDIPYEDIDTKSVANLLRSLEQVEKGQDLVEIFEDYNICTISPLLYTRLADDLLKKANVNLDVLENRSILGVMLENYVKGTAAYQSSAWNLVSYKIGEGNEEVDLVDIENNILCEITLSNKKMRDVYLNKHFKNKSFLRILATKDIEDFRDGIHRIPYLKLCMLLDRGLANMISVVTNG